MRCGPECRSAGSPRGSRRSIQRIVPLPIADEATDGAGEHDPNGDADDVAGAAQLIEMSMGPLEGVGAVLLNHCQRSAPSVGVMHESHAAIYPLPAGRGPA